MKPITSSLLAATLAVSMLSAVTVAHADTLVIPLGHQASDQATAMPQHGLGKNTVTQRFGEPSKRYTAVGQPPITRWDYPGFSVYFEYDRVIDSVRQRRPGSATTP
jgi:outer membrane protein assembly factor BamE (lipoprotein component of BamABCDE complex)